MLFLEHDYPFPVLVVGEVLALRRRDVDFDAKKFFIVRAWNINLHVFLQPKTQTSIRTVDLLAPLAEILLEYIKWRGGLKPDDLLFPSPEVDGQPLSYNTVYGVYKRCLAFLELPSVSLHSLRHTFASTLLAAGVPITTLARNLGHASPDITLRVYSHEIYEGLGESLERAEKLFGASKLEEEGDENSQG